MTLEYVWIENYKEPVKNVGLNITGEQSVIESIDNSHKRITLEFKQAIQIPNNYWGENISSVSAIVGENGSGKQIYGLENLHDTKDEDGFTVIQNAPLIVALNSCDAGIVAKVTKNGKKFTIDYTYYLIDYYDYDKSLLQDFYLMNRYGKWQNFVNYGTYSSKFTWEQGEYNTVIEQQKSFIKNCR